MGEGSIFNKINNLLAGTSYRGKINNLSELKEFINDGGSKGLEVYDQIEELYSILMLGPGMW